MLFFASIITHELVHSILAIRNNIPVKEITLFVFGGVSQITEEATHHRATRIATKVGQGIAYTIVAGGIAIILLPACCGLMACGSINWLVFRDAARASYPQVLLRDAPIGITARHVTDYANPLVPPHMNLTELVEQYILPTGRSCFLISWGAELEGMVTLQQIKKIPRTRWAITSAQDILTLASKLKTVHVDQDVLSVLQEMDGENINHIPVIEAGKVVGVINREELIRFLCTRADLVIRLTSG